MALTLTPPPGTYTSPQTVTVTGPADVTGVIVTSDGSDPVIVKTVASSNAYAPTEFPYVQTIEDGRGNAVFDGAFTKYYNERWVLPENANGNPTSFAQLSGSFKFLYNALNFIRKNGTGTRLLVLGDRTGVPLSKNYMVKSPYDAADPGLTGWYTSMTSLAALMGFSITVKDSGDYGGTLNPTYAECMNYDMIVLFSSEDDALMGGLTVAGAANMAQARRNGVGLYVCTDNGGGPVGSTDRYPEQFYRTANVLLAAITNANFQGNLNLNPGTTVAYNVSLHGNSPLFSGLAPTDIIGASTSDSYVNQAVTVPVALPTTVPISTGYTSLKFAVIHTDGSVTFEQYGYNVGQPPIVELCESDGTVIPSWPQTNLRNRQVFFKYSPGAFGSASGFVKVGNIVVGEFSNVASGVIPVSWLTTVYTPTPGTITMPGSSNLNVYVELSEPVVFEYVWLFDRLVPNYPRDLGSFIAQINRNEFASSIPSAAPVLASAFQQLGVSPKLDTGSACIAVYTAMT